MDSRHAMRVLFLDFDGVLHPLGLELEAGRVINGKPVARPVQVDYFCWLGLLKQLLAGHPDVRIVVHSSWRASHDLAQCQGYFGDMADLVIDVTRADLEKLASIRDWLTHHPQVTQWRALDDAAEEFRLKPVDPDEFVDPEAPPDVPEFIECHWQRGITAPDVQAKLQDWLKQTC